MNFKKVQILTLLMITIHANDSLKKKEFFKALKESDLNQMLIIFADLKSNKALTDLFNSMFQDKYNLCILEYSIHSIQNSNLITYEISKLKEKLTQILETVPTKEK